MSQYSYFMVFGVTQLLHSQEEVWTDFHKRWFVFTMPRWVFVLFESILSLGILLYLIWPTILPIRTILPLFAIVMLINGIGHIIWGLIKKSYVPGLVTAPIFVITFLAYFSSLT